MSEAKGRRPPVGLRPVTRRWWRSIVTTWELDEPGYRLLEVAAQQWDRAEEARDVLREHGLTYTDRWGAPKPRPELLVEKNARMLFLRAVRELQLSPTPPAPDTRPPR